MLDMTDDVPGEAPDVCLAAFRPPSWANAENPQQIKKMSVTQIV